MLIFLYRGKIHTYKEPRRIISFIFSSNTFVHLMFNTSPYITKKVMHHHSPVTTKALRFRSQTYRTMFVATAAVAVRYNGSITPTTPPLFHPHCLIQETLAEVTSKTCAIKHVQKLLDIGHCIDKTIYFSDHHAKIGSR